MFLPAQHIMVIGWVNAYYQQSGLNNRKLVTQSPAIKFIHFLYL